MPDGQKRLSSRLGHQQVVRAPRNERRFAIDLHTWMIVVEQGFIGLLIVKVNAEQARIATEFGGERK
ncbi:MAG: hypothetical protein C4345_10005, partial [Chloroflexota bacterium]